MNDAAAPLVCYIHINKNGGNTLNDALERRYSSGFAEFLLQGRRSGSGAKTVDSDDAAVRETLAEIRDAGPNIECVAVNLPYGVHRHVERPVRYFTFLRDPVARCISYWYWLYRNRERGNGWAALECYDFDVREIVESGRFPQFVNDQTRFVTGSADLEITEDHLEQAKHLIAETFVFVGAVERFADCYDELARRLEWPASAPGHLNRGDHRDGTVLPEGAASHFEDANDIDRRLYEWLTRYYLPEALDR